jgi:pimeloyl-ACP methyl ester carboxylesterase
LSDAATISEETAMAFEDISWMSHDGLRLHARDYRGDADPSLLPVICLHGLTRNARDFETIAPAIAATGRRVIAAEMRGRAGSDRDPDPSNYHFATYVDDVAALLDQLGTARAIFIGTSMGGMISIHLSAARPDLIAAVILNDIGPEIAPEGLVRIAAYIGKVAPVTNWQDAADYARTTNGAALPGYGAADWMRLARRLFRENAEGVPVLDYDPGIAGAKGPPTGTAEDNWRMFEAMARACPVLLLRGAISDILSSEIADRMLAAAPSLRLVTVPGVGHAPVLDEPEALAAIELFLRELD